MTKSTNYTNANLVKKIKIIIKLIYQRNKIICHDYNRKIVPKTVNLNYWQIDSENNINNLGDYLSLIVVQHMLDQRRIAPNTQLKKTKHLYAIGSILLTGFQDCTVWGTGIKERLQGPAGKITLFINKRLRKLDIRAVRGPLTKQYLMEQGIKCPEIYGDPAILMPLIYTKKQKKTTKNILVINHYSQKKNTKYRSISLRTKDYKAVIDEICKSKLVISGSLHGIILAESYGVPAILLKDRENFSIFKYRDYYLSTGREKFPVANTIEEAIKTTPPEIPAQTLAKMQKKLIDAFPYDLWDNEE